MLLSSLAQFPELVALVPLLANIKYALFRLLPGSSDGAIVAALVGLA